MVRLAIAALVVTLAATAGSPTIAAKTAAARANRPNGRLAVASLDAEIRGFLGRELAAHLGAIASFDPPPARVHNAMTTGEFTWGTFMRALAAYAQLTGATAIGGRDLARTIGEIGLLEVRLGGTRFSQLYAGLSLRHFGSNLSRNRLWLALTPSERVSWATLVDATRFYDPVKRQVVDLPDNYFGVAARIAATAWEVGLLKDRALLDPLLDRAAMPFSSGAVYADDGFPTGRYDRYSNEYARYVWEAATIAGRADLLDALRPSLRAQMRLWWDLVAPDGYGYPWGRSVGVVSYLDTLEIAGFLATNPEFRPASLEQIAAAYRCAWRWLRADYKDDRHLLSIFTPGRGNFAYIGRDREWQQTIGFLGKLAQAHAQLMSGLRADEIDDLPAAPVLPDVARFEFFQRNGRQAGVWVVRQGPLRFTLPITTATRPGVADYLPAPHGLPGFAAPVEQLVPALVPFLELDDGRTIVAADGADAIEPAADGRTLRARWTRWAQLGAAAGERIDPGLESLVEWRIGEQSLTRTERLVARRPLNIRRWRVAVPATGARWLTYVTGSVRSDVFDGPDGELAVVLVQADWPYGASQRETGEGPAGRGARTAIPLHLSFAAADVELTPGAPKAWTIQLALKGKHDR